MDAPGADLSRTWALVPIRGLESAKTRLGADLEPAERRRLVAALLRRTLVATRDARLGGTVVVTMDGDAAEMAREHGAIGLVERAPGLNEAISAARSVALARDASAVLVLPADLPAISAAAIDGLIEAARGATGSPAAGGAFVGLVGLVPDRHGSGTNALLLGPPGVIDPAFGPGSLDRHEAAAARAGARVVRLDSPLSLDVDTSADLLEAEAALGPLRG